MDKATFAAGCFWSVEAEFRKLKGVTSTAVGYTGGDFPDPTYFDVCAGATGHAEAVLLEFDPTLISYEQLLDIFWAIHDPTTPDRQGADIGPQYRSAIFFHTPEQQSAAFRAKVSIDARGTFPCLVVTEIVRASTFFRAEEYHQQRLERRGASRRV